MGRNGGGLFTLFFVGWGVSTFIQGGRSLLTRARVDAPEATLSNNSPRVGEAVTFSHRQTFRASTDVPMGEDIIGIQPFILAPRR